MAIYSSDHGSSRLIWIHAVRCGLLQSHHGLKPLTTLDKCFSGGLLNEIEIKFQRDPDGPYNMR